MIDPVTAIGLASAAYRGIKSAIQTGKELHDMAGTLSQWAGAMSDLDFSHKQAQNPPMFKKLFGASQIEQNALEIWGHKQKAKELREDLRSHISLYYGPSAWEEVLQIEAQMRKQRKEEIYRKEELKRALIEWTVGILLVLSGIVGLAIVLYFMGRSQGKW